MAHRFKKTSFLGLILIVCLLAGCNGFPLGATETPTSVPTDTPTPVPPTATPSATPTQTPTPTATPTPTITPTPTATPEGYILMGEAGFALLPQPSWEIDTQDAETLILVDAESGTRLYATSFMAEENLTYIDLFKIYEDGFWDAPVSSSENAETMKLANGLSGYTKAVNFDTPQGEFGTYIFAIQHNKRVYFLIFANHPKIIPGFVSSYNQLINTLEVFTPRPYDLDRDSTVFQLGGDPEAEDLDPAVYTGSADDYIGLLYSGLVRLTSSMQVVPELAEGWAVSSDGLVYTFTLRENLQFASGAPITAQTVKDSWERACDPAVDSSTARTYLGDIVGVDEKLDGEAGEISGVTVVDERTLEVRIDEPKSYFIAKLTYPTAFIMNAADAKDSAEDWVFDADTSGAYVIREYHPEEGIVFERNPLYFAQPAVPYLVFDFAPGGSPLSLYEEGSIDILPLDTESTVLISRATHPLNADLKTGISMCTSMLFFNTRKAPLDDPKVRLAFALAVNKAELNLRFFDNQPLIAQSILPPAMPGFNAEISAPAFDADAAKAALAESTYAAGLPPITFSLSGYPGDAGDNINAMIRSWEDILGADITIEYVDPSNYTEELRNNPGHLVSYGWCADYPDPENFLDLLYHSASEFNPTGYSNPEVDALLEQARSEADPAVRIELYQQAESLILEEVAVLPLFHSRINRLVSPRVQGYAISPMGTSYVFDIALVPGN